MNNSNFYFLNAKNHLKVYETLYFHKLFFLNEKRFLRSLFSELFLTTESLIKSLLLYEMENKNLEITRDFSKDLKIFFKIAKRYLSKQEIEYLDKLVKMSCLKAKSEMEFLRTGKLVLHSDGKYVIFSRENLINHYSQLKRMCFKVSNLFG